MQAAQGQARCAWASFLRGEEAHRPPPVDQACNQAVPPSALTSPRRTWWCSCAGWTRRCGRQAARCKASAGAVLSRVRPDSPRSPKNMQTLRTHIKQGSHNGIVRVGGGQSGSCLSGQLVQLRSSHAPVDSSCDLLGHQNLHRGFTRAGRGSGQVQARLAFKTAPGRSSSRPEGTNAKPGQRSIDAKPHSAPAAGSYPCRHAVAVLWPSTGPCLPGRRTPGSGHRIAW